MPREQERTTGDRGRHPGEGRLEKVARHDELSLGFAVAAFTSNLRFEGDEEPTVFEAVSLARWSSDGSPPTGYDDRWRAFGLNQPIVYEHYRDNLPLAEVLASVAQYGRCLYCGSRMRVAQSRHRNASDGSSWKWAYTGAQCNRCGWWAVEHEETPIDADIDEHRSYAYAVLREFDPLALDVPMKRARDYLGRHPHKLARFDPFRFEELMADCLKDYFGEAEIIKVGGRRDGGIDLKVIRTGDVSVLVQVKRRADFARREGVHTYENCMASCCERVSPAA